MFALILPILSLLHVTNAYIPASASNSTNITSILTPSSNSSTPPSSTIALQWFKDGKTGSVGDTVSYQLAGAGTNGLAQGALVHFDEVGNMTARSDDDFSATPWIAFVNCDSNTTTASEDTDIFTFAQDRGAVAALMFSTRSNSCIINPFFRDPIEFAPIMDIYSLESIQLSQLIQSRIASLGPPFKAYNSTLLNSTSVSDSIQSAIRGNDVDKPGFMFATLRAGNATADPDTTPGDDGNNSNGTGGGQDRGHVGAGGGGGKKNLAMIILYTITGCVSAVFVIVIISGAIRALRHPERYGRAAQQQRRRAHDLNNPNFNPDNQGQGATRTAAVGLTRAILDTFPVIKFGFDSNNSGTNSNAGGNTNQNGRGKDLEAGEGEEVEMKDVSPVSKTKHNEEVYGGDEEDLGELGLVELDAHDRLSHAKGDERKVEDRVAQGDGTNDKRLSEVDQPQKEPSTIVKSSNPPPLEEAEAEAGASSSSPRISSSTSSPHDPLPSSSSTPASSSNPRQPHSSNPSMDDPVESPSLEVDPTTIGHETCPICIIDFELGDDLRVLPCEGKHRFHQRCVDLWLLEMSSSCPLCREDFQTLEAMVQSDPDRTEDTSRRRRARRRFSTRHRAEGEPMDPEPELDGDDGGDEPTTPEGGETPQSGFIASRPHGDSSTTTNGEESIRNRASLSLHPHPHPHPQNINHSQNGQNQGSSRFRTLSSSTTTIIDHNTNSNNSRMRSRIRNRGANNTNGGENQHQQRSRSSSIPALNSSTSASTSSPSSQPQEGGEINGGGEGRSGSRPRLKLSNTYLWFAQRRRERNVANTANDGGAGAGSSSRARARESRSRSISGIQGWD